MSRLLDLQDLSETLGRSPETIKKDLKRNPLAVPPRLHIPGTRLLRWRLEDVDAWLAGYVFNFGTESRNSPTSHHSDGTMSEGGLPVRDDRSPK